MTAEGIWIGHWYLQPPGAPATERSDAVTVAVDAAPTATERLALQLLSPIAALEPARRATQRILLSGADLDLLATACAVLGCREWQRAAVVAPTDDSVFHQVLHGCGGARPSLDDLAPLLARLRPEGQIGLYALPRSELDALQSELSRHGFSLRAAGTADDLACLGGSLEHPAGFAS